MVQYITQLDIKDQSWRLKETNKKTKTRNLMILQNNSKVFCLETEDLHIFRMKRNNQQTIILQAYLFFKMVS